MIKLHDILTRSAETGLQIQRSDGSMPAGTNGPYNDHETPVRNTSHWLLTFLKAYNITEENRFFSAAERCSDYLLSEEARPNGKTFHHRRNENKDFCNGLIGQAWTIEALSTASDILGNPKLQETAEEVFLLHPFDDNLGLWQVVEINGEILDYDMTFNHQLWFAAAASMLQSEEACLRVNKFLNDFNRNIKLYPNGLIFHKTSRAFGFGDVLRCGISTSNRKFCLSKIKEIGRKLHPDINRLDRHRNRSIGYHSFNTYALAVLKENEPSHKIWQSPIIKKILKYSSSKIYKKEIKNNKYGYPYNPPGIENAYTIEVFENDSADALTEWLDTQFEKTLDSECWLMNKGTPDPETSGARIYEATRLSNFTLSCVAHC